MYEWDYSAYNRKFAGTLAYSRVEGKPWGWNKIKEITTEGVVYNSANVVLGEALSEQTLEKQTPLPVFQFKYAPIACGVYGHVSREDVYYTVTRRHIKSWKIGLSSEAYIIREYKDGKVNTKDYRADIDMESPVTKQVFIDKKDLILFDTEIGFVEGSRILLRNAALKPLIQPILGDEWQIVDL